MPLTRLLLASASPRRLALLRGLGLDPVVSEPRVAETPSPGEAPDEMVLRLAESKGREVASRLPATAPPSLVLAADTAVVLAGRVLGKPRDAADAAAMLRDLRGQTHEVLTAVFVLRTDDGRGAAGVERTRVRFRDYDEATIRDYVASGEPMDKAGAYGIQGTGSRLAEHVDGSWSNVVGLPLERLPDWLARVGLRLEDLARAG